MFNISMVSQKLGAHVTKKCRIMIIKRFQKGSKLQNLQFHCDAPQYAKYAELRKLPLPLNFKDLPHSERMAFSKEKGRDILGLYLSAFSCSSHAKYIDRNPHETDSRIGKYICTGSVDLSSSMQTNVPEPFSAKSQPVHLNMPQGQLRQEAKYISEQLQNFHYMNMRFSTPIVHPKRFLSSEEKKSESDKIHKSSEVEISSKDKEQTKTQKLKAAVKEYGPTILVLHVSVSVVSLIVCYLVVKSGFNMEEIIQTYGLSDTAGVIASAGPFIITYALNLILMPFLILLTLIVSPFLVKFLRKRGFKIKGNRIEGNKRDCPT